MRKRKLEVTKGVKAAMITQPRHYLEAQGQLRPANGGAAAASVPGLATTSYSWRDLSLFCME